MPRSSPLLHDRFPALRATLPHVVLGEGPTPVRRLRAVADAEAWIKEDGRYGGPYGGNKVRKLDRGGWDWRPRSCSSTSRSTGTRPRRAQPPRRCCATPTTSHSTGLRCQGDGRPARDGAPR